MLSDRIPNPAPRGQTARRAFTLVELLVVIGIIILLIGILVPVVSSARRAARVADTRNQVSVISSAIELYYHEFKAYPGPLSNDQIIANSATPGLPTMSENLVLGLLGGWTYNGTYNADTLGQGPLSFNTTNPKRYSPYLDANRFSNQLSGGRFADAGGMQANDSDIPEFVDRFNDPLPILYMRARVGAPGIISNSDAARYQYDIRQIQPYTSTTIGIPSDQSHGIKDLGNFVPLDAAPAPTSPYAGLTYFMHPQLHGANNDSGTPRQKDSYILISPGPDRIYGTADDICNFGSVTP